PTHIYTLSLHDALPISPNHLLELDDAGIKVLLEKKLSYVVTLDDLIALEKDDLRDTGGRNSRMRLAEQAFKRALAAGVPIVFGRDRKSTRLNSSHLGSS